MFDPSDFSSDELLLLASQLRAEYNKTRRLFASKAHHYDHQSISNNYHKESDMIELLETCRALKDKYKAVADVLVNRDHRSPVESWGDSKDKLFSPRDILHSA